MSAQTLAEVFLKEEKEKERIELERMIGFHTPVLQAHLKNVPVQWRAHLGDQLEANWQDYTDDSYHPDIRLNIFHPGFEWRIKPLSS